MKNRRHTASKQSKSSLPRRSQRGGNPEHVLYLGAGGGGDTNAAIIRAMMDDDRGDIERFVMGAGYLFEGDYKKALMDGVKKRDNSGKYDRPTNKSVDVTEDQITKYLQSTMQVVSPAAVDTPSKEDTGIYKFQVDTIVDTKDEQELFNKFLTREILIDFIKGKANKLPEERSGDKDQILKQIKEYEKDPKLNILDPVIDFYKKLGITKPDEIYLQQSSSFKYRSLLDERIAIRYFNQHEKDKKRFEKIKDRLYMFASTDNMDGILEVKRAYQALQTFIQAKQITRIVLMDFGGDIFDYAKVQRDTAVLMMLLRMINNQTNLFTIDVEVYGPGCDAHETVTQTIENMKKIGDKFVVEGPTAEPSTSTLKKMTDILKTHKDELKKYDILGPGRATGNFLQAYELAAESESENTIQQMDEWLWARPDSKAAFNDLKLKDVKLDNNVHTSFQQAYGLLNQGDKTKDSKFKRLYDQLYGDQASEGLLTNLASLYKITINQNNIKEILKNLENNTTSFKDSSIMLDDIQGVVEKQESFKPEYKPTDYVNNGAFKDRFNNFRKNDDLIKDVLAFENHQSLGGKNLKLPFIPAPIFKKQNPFSLIAENYTSTKVGKLLVDAYNKEVKDDKVNSYIELNQLHNPSLSCFYDKEKLQSVDDYTAFLEKHGKDTMYPKFYKEYNDFVLIINIKLPMRHWANKITEAGMGLVHLLALPKTRKYNVMSLGGEEDAKMLQAVQTAVNELFSGPNNRKNKEGIIKVIIGQLIDHLNKDSPKEDVKKYLYKQLFSNNSNSNNLVAPNVTLPNGLPLTYNDFITKSRMFIDANDVNFEYFFHGHPDHSMGYLHMHCVSSSNKFVLREKRRNKNTKSNSNTFVYSSSDELSKELIFRTSNLHDRKSIPVTEELINFINEQTPVTAQEGGKGKKKIGLEKLPVAELLQRAKSKGVINARQYKKDQLVAILRGHVKVPRKKVVKK